MTWTFDSNTSDLARVQKHDQGPTSKAVDVAKFYWRAPPPPQSCHTLHFLSGQKIGMLSGLGRDMRLLETRPDVGTFWACHEWAMMCDAERYLYNIDVVFIYLKKWIAIPWGDFRSPHQRFVNWALLWDACLSIAALSPLAQTYQKRSKTATSKLSFFFFGITYMFLERMSSVKSRPGQIGTLGGFLCSAVSFCLYYFP